MPVSSLPKLYQVVILHGRRTPTLTEEAAEGIRQMARNIRTFVFDILFDSLYQVNGAPSYAVHVESFIPIINANLNNIQRALDSTGAIDILPRVLPMPEVHGLPSR